MTDHRQYALPQPPESLSDESAEDTFDPRDYRAMSPAAVASLVLGALSIITLFDWLLVVVPLLGIALGWFALRQIRRRPGELTGKRLAIAGLALSLAFWLFGYTRLTAAHYSEIPEGYLPISFATLQPDENESAELLPRDVVDMGKNERQVFIEGYMYPGRQSIGIKQFILVPTRGHCKFCSRSLKSTEMVHVTLEGDLTANFTTHAVQLGGRIKVNEEEARNPFGGMPYELSVDFMR